jgi:hypothetical protein
MNCPLEIIHILWGAQVSLEARLEDERKTAMEVREKFLVFFLKTFKESLTRDFSTSGFLLESVSSSPWDQFGPF